MASAKRNSGARSRYGSRIRSGNKKLFSLSIKQLTVFASLYHISHTSRSGTLSRTHSRQRQLPLFCRFWRTELQKKNFNRMHAIRNFLAHTQIGAIPLFPSTTTRISHSTVGRIAVDLSVRSVYQLRKKVCHRCMCFRIGPFTESRDPTRQF